MALLPPAAAIGRPWVVAPTASNDGIQQEHEFQGELNSSPERECFLNVFHSKGLSINTMHIGAEI